ncbi:hypothetical protein APR41_16030 [Salegentibacter salinarum]|uniref:4-alpha-L-fucosyltransferase n=1 Tax=Salegentibacter salinarum TaxID=447422 RepID=A0A2N0TXT7_9FLAO|nr:TDP-N-acetylfucosamine:lipid II N-acetylfucosaminyltransferase [Salegentibacter salinarum]PKD19468.1 hypothetical protein APR41_16030 [Salegentibacter salinarum]SKB91944.1 4-alpha-L-fucosyltransferase glycosyl transferase group 56 [Salegentibacter salinarum]
MKKIIHIASDEKFINSAYWQFNEVFPNRNLFYLLVDNPYEKLKYVNQNQDFLLVEKKIKTLKVLAKNLSYDKIVIFHGLDYYSAFLLNKISKDCQIVWFLWGWEVYNNPLIVDPRNIIGPITYSKFLKKTGFKVLKSSIKNILRPVYYQLFFQTNTPSETILTAIRNVKFCGILFKEEVDFIHQKISQDVDFLKFSYYPIELMVKNEKARVNATNILVGNSASENNNHLEIFELLQRLPLMGKKIIVPLSYGKKNYADSIISKGREIFPENFEPLIDFLPLHQYNEYLQQCGIVIMNHYRQQAIGNVLSMLWLGSKIYLDERNSIFHFLKRKGIHVFSIEKDLRRENLEVFDLLSFQEQNRNREILKKEVGEKQLLKELKNNFEEYFR